MSKKLWFKARPFGWGWYPASWEGWVVILVFIAVIAGLGIRIGGMEGIDDDSQTVLSQFVLPMFALIVVLLVITFKTGEKPEWRWMGKLVGPDTARTLTVLTFVSIVAIIGSVVYAILESIK